MQRKEKGRQTKKKEKEQSDWELRLGRLEREMERKEGEI